MKILDRFSGAVKFEFEAPSIKLVVEAAIKSGANLCNANLSGADLGGATLRSANLGGANLSGANLRSANLGGANLSGADLSGANLRSANLGGANLRNANLGGAYLGGAYLSGASNSEKLTLIGERSVFTAGPLGSRNDTLMAFITDKGVWMRVGCFWGTLKVFTAAVKKIHGTSKYAKEYAAAIAQIKLHAKLWSVIK